MGLWELLMIGVGLSMDAFAVALCRGLHMTKLNKRHAVIIALFFGGFQAAMPLLGWLLGKQFAGYISSLGDWIAFGLLAFIGGKMIWEVYHREEECCENGDELRLKELFLLAVATSIDALAVGVTFAFLKVSILPASLLIGATTFVLSLAGVLIGHRFGARFQSKAEIAGGVVLILMGVKILLEHFGIL